MPTILAILSQANWAYSTLSIWSAAVITEVSSTKAEKNHSECMRRNICHPRMGPTVNTGFHNGQASYFNMKVFVFSEPGHMQFFFKPQLSYKSLSQFGPQRF